MTNIEHSQNAAHIEQVNQSVTVHEQVSRCPTHGQWVLKAHGCDLCRFERAIHPAGTAA